MGLNCFGISFSSPNITLDSDPTHQKLSKSGYHAIWKEWKENAVPGEGEQRGIAVERMKYCLKKKLNRAQPQQSWFTFIARYFTPLYHTERLK